MDDKIKKQLEMLSSKAKRFSAPVPKARKRSSLHTIIKTKEQAERFMKALKSA